MPLIDTHTHFLPEIYKERLKSIGITSAGGLAFPEWNKSILEDIMAQFGIDISVLSLSSPGADFGDEKFTIDLIKCVNDALADIVSANSMKFGGFASLPLPNIDESLKTIEYSLDMLKLDGIILLTNYNSQYLGHDDFIPIFEELNRRHAVVFIHPTEPVEFDPNVITLPPSMVEFVSDTTRTVADLLFSGRFEQFQNIRFILSHAGGTIPYVAGRMQMFETLKPELKDKVPQGTMYYLKKLYYDTTLSTSAISLSCLLDFIPSNQVLFGSDFPFVPKQGIAIETKEFDAYFNKQKDIKNRVCSENAVELFPRFKPVVGEM